MCPSIIFIIDTTWMFHFNLPSLHFHFYSLFDSNIFLFHVMNFMRIRIFCVIDLALSSSYLSSFHFSISRQERNNLHLADTLTQIILQNRIRDKITRKAKQKHRIETGDETEMCHIDRVPATEIIMVVFHAVILTILDSIPLNSPLLHFLYPFLLITN